MMTLRNVTVVVLVFAAALAACGNDRGSSSSSIGENCTQDQVLWRFETATPDASFTPAPRNVITEVTHFRCRFQPLDGGLITNIEEVLGTNQNLYATRNCRDMTSCSLPSTCLTDTDQRIQTAPRWSVESFAIWKCSDGQTYEDQHANRTTVAIACPAPISATDPPLQRTACVPRVCNGSTRRDENMACVQDLARPLLREEQMRLPSFRIEPRYMPFHVRAPGDPVHSTTGYPVSQAALSKRLDNHNLYRVTGGVTYVGVPPTNARAALWMSEVHDDAVDGGTGSESFRCLVKTLDVGLRTADGGTVAPGTTTARFDTDLELPPDCFNEAIALRHQDPYKRGVQVRKKVKELKFHLSFDLENSTRFVPRGKTQADACAADPTDFFYVSSTDTYDLRSYYRQHELVPTDTSFRGFFDGAYSEIYPGNRIELGLSDVRSEKPVVTIRVNSKATQTISVSGDWYLALDSLEFVSGWLKKNMSSKMVVYLVPQAGGTYTAPPPEGFPSIGSLALPLGGFDGRPLVGPAGVTVNGRFLVDSNLKQQFLTPGSLAYVADGQQTFEVLGCFDAKAGDYWIAPQYWRSDVAYNFGFWGITAGNDKDTDLAYRPPGFPSPGRACRWSKTPLVIIIDKSIGAVEPIGDELWQGQSNNQAGGNSSVKQSNDNDVDRTCQPGDGGVDRCDQGSGAGQRGQGDYGKSYYATSTSSVYSPQVRTGASGMPEDDSEAGGGAEVLGYQVLDPEQDEPTKQWQTDNVKKTQKVTLTITPPWDSIWQAIRQANQGNTNPEWVKGRYAGLMGLGVGWGYKQPVGSFGMVTFTISVGFSLALTVSVTHTFEGESTYKCIKQAPTDGSVPSPCVQLGDESRGFVEAVTDCGTRGARLAELSSLGESALTDNLMNGTASPIASMWVGAQQFDEFNPAFCAFTWVDGACRAKHKTGYRWLSNDAAFASAVGGATGSLDLSRIFLSGGVTSGLIPRAPARAGVLLNSNGSVSSETVARPHPYACIYDPAVEDRTVTLAVAVELGFAVGAGIEWCWPNDELGICLAGTLNLVAMKVAPTVETSFHLLKDYRGRKARRDNTNLYAEWGITFLEGAVELKIKALVFELSLMLIEFSGFKLPGDKLYDFNFPSMEPFR